LPDFPPEFTFYNGVTGNSRLPGGLVFYADFYTGISVIFTHSKN